MFHILRLIGLCCSLTLSLQLYRPDLECVCLLKTIFQLKCLGLAVMASFSFHGLLCSPAHCPFHTQLLPQLHFRLISKTRRPPAPLKAAASRGDDKFSGSWRAGKPLSPLTGSLSLSKGSSYFLMADLRGNKRVDEGRQMRVWGYHITSKLVIFTWADRISDSFTFMRQKCCFYGFGLCKHRSIYLSMDLLIYLSIYIEILWRRSWVPPGGATEQ